MQPWGLDMIAVPEHFAIPDEHVDPALTKEGP